MTGMRALFFLCCETATYSAPASVAVVLSLFSCVCDLVVEVVPFGWPAPGSLTVFACPHVARYLTTAACSTLMLDNDTTQMNFTSLTHAGQQYQTFSTSLVRTKYKM